MSHRFKHQLALAALAAFLLALAVPGFAAQVQVYVQNPDYNNLYASQNDTSVGGFGNFATAYDNFKLGSATTITEANWIGGYYNPQSAGSITAWTLVFYSDNSGQPGSALASYNISGNASESSLGVDNLGNPVFGYIAQQIRQASC